MFAVIKKDSLMRGRGGLRNKRTSTLSDIEDRPYGRNCWSQSTSALFF